VVNRHLNRFSASNISLDAMLRLVSYYLNKRNSAITLLTHRIRDVLTND